MQGEHILGALPVQWHRNPFNCSGFKMWLQIDTSEPPYFCSLFQQNHRLKSNFLAPPFRL